MRLIDADALKLAICRDQCEKDGCDYTCSDIAYVVNAPTVGGWISVKKRLPELKRYDEDGDTWLMSAPVLVATTKGVTIGYYEDDLDPKFKPCWNDMEHGEKIKVTYWMELPERPKK